MTATILGGLADASIRITLVAAIVAAVLWALRVRASAVRHRAWTAVVVAMLLMPALRLVIPPIAIPVPVTTITVRSIANIEPAATAGFATLKGSRHNDTPVANLNGPRDNEPLATLKGSRHNDGEAPAPTLKGPRHNDGETPAATLPSTGAVHPEQSPGTKESRYSSLLLPSILVLYAVVAFALLVRVFAGWRAVRSVAAAGDAIVIDGVDDIPGINAVRVRESRIVTTPMTVGVVTPVVLLPTAWRRWPQETLRAVLAHEMAHVRRRDGLVGVISRVNRSIFWFHPLAWWLERTLAATAEHASDDVALVATGERGRYAEILVEMARTVRRHGGRVSWQAVGIDGSGLLAERIDRVLRDDRSHDSTAVRKYSVAIACGAAIVLAAACRPQASVPHPSAALEQRDHLLRIQLSRLPYNPAGSLHFDDTDEPSLDVLESAVRQDPEDLAKLQRVLDAYWTNPVANPTESRRSHILWLIEHHPDSTLAGSVEARIYPVDVQLPFPNDPSGYAMSKSAWLAQTNKPGVSAGVLGNASYFLEVADKPLAEDMLLRARALDPNGPWTARLGRFYALVLAGSDMLSGKGMIRRVSQAEPNSAFGSAVRRKLAESNDDALLTAAGVSLRNSSWQRFSTDTDPRPWAEACFKRALQFNPDAILAHGELLEMTTSVSRDVQPLWDVPADSEYEYVSALPEAERFARLPEEASAAIAAMTVGGEWDDRNLDDYVRLAKDRAKKYADDIFKLAPKYRDNPRYGMAIYAANMTLGSLALADGQKDRALEYLRNAAQAPRSEELTYLSGFAWGQQWRLPRRLLKQGVREPVALFLEQIAEVNLADRADLVQAAAAIRRGETPPTPPFPSY